MIDVRDVRTRYVVVHILLTLLFSSVIISLIFFASFRFTIYLLALVLDENQPKKRKTSLGLG